MWAWRRNSSGCIGQSEPAPAAASRPSAGLVARAALSWLLALHGSLSIRRSRRPLPLGVAGLPAEHVTQARLGRICRPKDSYARTARPRATRPRLDDPRPGLLRLDERLHP